MHAVRVMSAELSSTCDTGLHVRPKKEVRLGLDGDRRRDWHDQEGIRRDAARSGSLAGVFHEEANATQVQGVCRTKLYLEKLPNTSIIIPFHNEGWSSLLRTVHSVLHRSPPQLLAEIILVDDFSDKEHLKAALEAYMVRLPKVRIVRTKKREGLIRTRLLGASVAIGGVITFLDSHCEANVNWLPPLLDRIAQNRKTIVCPMIDVIDHDNFGYETQAGDAMRGAFDWEMYYKRIPIPSEIQNRDPSEPFE
ncbi:UNVERIFIED_CONTAM: hypothetical protein FKN15_035931 [Acipenser sinensis]